MNNEPVAWKVWNRMGGISFQLRKPNDSEYVEYEPLYTHPVKELDEQYEKGFKAGKEEGWKAHKFHHPVKELTDEEIEEVFCSLDYGHSLNELARALLRKAQEK
jgi:hypothetical protein